MEPTTTTPQHERSLVTGDNPDERYPLPDKPKLRAGDGVIRAHDLGTIARTLIDADDFPFAELAELKIAYLWAEKGGLVGGFPAFGRMRKEDKVHRHFSGFDYIATLSVDHLNTIKATRWQVEALVAHQLGHIAVATTEKGEKRYGTKGHDFEGFAFEFDHYGVYLSGQVAGAESIALAIQMGMVFEGDDEEGDDEDFDPTGHLPPAGEGEIGPDPTFELSKVTWSEREPGAAISDDDLTYQDVVAEREQHLAKIREDYGTRVLDDGSEVCKRCGIRAEDHPIDVCAGGVPEKPLKTDPQMSSTNSTKNVTHDDALPLIDPDRVIHTLSELGIQIAYQYGIGETVGRYVHPVSGEEYSTSWAESEYRGAIANTKREKAGVR